MIVTENKKSRNKKMFMNIEKKKQFNLQDFIKLVLANKMS